ncbi:hypothetical protein VTJ04DRAFT_2995 [Mycothermus thermophilus]|uniref:uncharacterized protein n=1 Tax=Humicola insolens TaxID=85995 RepID=UPI003743C526
MSLMKLPNETLLDICNHFTVDLVYPELEETQIKSLFPDKNDTSPPSEGEVKYITRQCFEDEQTWHEAHTTLSALARTNRRLHDIANPFLYRTIRIKDLRVLYSLINTLLEAPRLAKLVRHVSIVKVLARWLGDPDAHNPGDLAALDELMESLDHKLDDDPDCVDATHTTYHRIAKLFPELDMRIRQACEKYYTSWIEAVPATLDEEIESFFQDEFVETACALLLLLTPEVRTLHSGLPQGKEHLFLRSILARRMEQRALPQLEELALGSEDLGVDRMADDPALPEAMLHDILLDRRLRHVKFRWPILLSPNPWTDMWAQVETLHAEWAYTSGAWWYSMCKGARPPLKDLKITKAPCFEEEASDQNDPGLNDALAFCTGTLQRLHLDMANCCTDFAWLHLGPQGRLACLVSMELLTQLCIPPRLLFSSMSDMRSTNICDRLPPNLQCLMLDQTSDVCFYYDPWSPSEFDVWLTLNGQRRSWLEERALYDLALESPDKLPYLQEVMLARRVICWNVFTDEAATFFERVPGAWWTPTHWFIKGLVFPRKLQQNTYEYE